MRREEERGGADTVPSFIVLIESFVQERSTALGYLKKANPQPCLLIRVSTSFRLCVHITIII
jgi:hypothetical protein